MKNKYFIYKGMFCISCPKTFYGHQLTDAFLLTPDGRVSWNLFYKYEIQGINNDK